MIIAILHHNDGERVGWIDNSMPDVLVEAQHTPDDLLKVASAQHTHIPPNWETVWLHPDWLLKLPGGGVLWVHAHHQLAHDTTEQLGPLAQRHADFVCPCHNKTYDPDCPLHGQRRCGAWAQHTVHGLGCSLPAGHNTSNADLPEAHQLNTTQQPPQKPPQP